MGFWKNLFTGSAATKGGVGGSGTGAMDPVSYQSDTGVRLFFSTDRTLIDLYELEELCDSVGWSRRPLRKVRKALNHSFLVVTMWEIRSTQKRLVGFSRATSDHAFNATIWDVVVSPRYQGKGLGRLLMQHTIKKLRNEDISNITLFADPHVVDFYRQMGFMVDPEGIKGMFWYPD